MIIEKEKILFDEWAKNRNGFSQDGIINETEYLASKIKILFILKEVNSENGFNLKEFLQKGGRSQTWNNISRWIFGIRNIEKEIKWRDLNDDYFTTERRKELLSSICVMNLKKSSGGHTTDNKELALVASQDTDYLNRQFQLYYNSEKSRPDFIICGGTSTSNNFNKLINIENKSDWKTTSRGVYYYEFDKGKYFIEYAHPEARVSNNLLYYGLIDAIKELKNNR